MRTGLMRFGIALFVLSWGWDAGAQLLPPPRPVVHKALEIEGPAIGGSISAVAPLGMGGGSADVGFNLELPIAHTLSVRADVGLADWNVPETSSLAKEVERVALARGTFVLVERPHQRPGSYFGVGVGFFRYELGADAAVRRAPGLTLLGGVETSISRKVVLGLELHGHFISYESRGIPAELSFVAGAALRVQWRR